jgi:hypothetical protein
MPVPHSSDAFQQLFNVFHSHGIRLHEFTSRAYVCQLPKRESAPSDLLSALGQTPLVSPLRVRFRTPPFHRRANSDVLRTRPSANYSPERENRSQDGKKCARLFCVSSSAACPGWDTRAGRRRDERLVA